MFKKLICISYVATCLLNAAENNNAQPPRNFAQKTWACIKEVSKPALYIFTNYALVGSSLAAVYYFTPILAEKITGDASLKKEIAYPALVLATPFVMKVTSGALNKYMQPQEAHQPKTLQDLFLQQQRQSQSDLHQNNRMLAGFFMGQNNINPKDKEMLPLLAGLMSTSDFTNLLLKKDNNSNHLNTKSGSSCVCCY